MLSDSRLTPNQFLLAPGQRTSHYAPGQRQTSNPASRRHLSELMPTRIDISLSPENSPKHMGCGEEVSGVSAAKVLLRHGHVSPEAYPLLVDFGCGTGSAAPLLHRAGWRHFIGLDPSDQMLHQAEQSGLYGKLVQAALPESSLPSNSADVVHAEDIFARGLAPPSAFDEIVRVLRPWGLAVFSIHAEFYDSEAGAAHKQRVVELLTAGRWKQVARTVESNVSEGGAEVYVFVMEVPKVGLTATVG